LSNWARDYFLLKQCDANDDCCHDENIDYGGNGSDENGLFFILKTPPHLSPNVLTSGRIFGSALVEHTTMGTLSGL